MAENPGATLLAIVGLSPAVVTETLYALGRENPATLVSRLVLAVTAPAEHLIRKHFLGKKGDLVRLIQRFPDLHPGFDISHCRVDVLRGENGAALEDISTPAASNAAADSLLEIVSELSRPGSSRLIGSLAGGRKTMSAHLALAFALRGRAADRLTHVLRTDDEESDPEHFLPSIAADRAHRSGERSLVTLVDVPFPLLAPQLRCLTEPPRTFSGLIEAQRRDEALRRSPPPLILDLDRESLCIGHTEVLLTFRELTIYRRFVGSKLHCDCAHEGHGCPDSRCFIAFGDAKGDRLELARSHMSRIKAKMTRALGSADAAALYAPALLRGPVARYGFRLNRNSVSLRGRREP